MKKSQTWIPKIHWGGRGGGGGGAGVGLNIRLKASNGTLVRFVIYIAKCKGEGHSDPPVEIYLFHGKSRPT